MKELSIQEKASRYDKAIIRGSQLWESDAITRENYEYIFPELKESEDEKIRKEIIRIVDIWTNSSPVVNGIPSETLLAWLEKKGEKPQGKSALEAINEEKVDDANKIEPKFNVGDKVNKIGLVNKEYNILTIEGVFPERGCYVCHQGTYIPFEKQDEWVLVEQKSAWSKKDDRILDGIIEEIEANKSSAPGYDIHIYDRFLSFLKSLKERHVWKPSKEQMGALANVCNGNILNLDHLNSLYQDLKKLKG